MDLKSAIARAAKFASKEENAGPLAYIQLSPHIFDPAQPIAFVDLPSGEKLPLPTQLGYVAASNGAVSMRCYLDPRVQIPAMLVDAVAVAKAVGAFKRAPFVVEACGATQAVVRGANGEHYFVGGEHHSAFPAFPEPPPQLFAFPAVREVLRLLHITKSNPKHRPDLVYLHAYAGNVEASDQMRIARVPVTLPVPEACLVHSALFAHWPRSVQRVSFATHKGRAFVSADDELRTCEAPSDEKFFDLRTKLPDSFHGCLAEVPRASFMNAVKFGTTASPLDVVELTFAKNEVEVCGLGRSAQRESRHVLDAPGATQTVRLLLRGRVLWDSLAALDAETVDVGYSSPEQPLRLEAAGGYLEAIWPLRPVEDPS